MASAFPHSPGRKDLTSASEPTPADGLNGAPRVSKSAQAGNAIGSEGVGPEGWNPPSEHKAELSSTVAATSPRTGLYLSPIKDLPPALSLCDQAATGTLYGLTRKEAELAAAMLKGKSIEEAAAELVISPQLARNHLKRILMKTDTAKIEMRSPSRPAK